MNYKLKEIFNQVQAEEELKKHTREYINLQRPRYAQTKARKYSHHIYAAAFTFLLVILFGGHWLYFTPIMTISIDINPSVELEVNRFNRVISVRSFNKDGMALTEELDMEFKNYTNVIEQILNNESIVELLSQNEVMTITVIGPDGVRSEQIMSEIEACAAEHHNTYCYFASSDEVAAAHAMGLSYGKYRAFLEIQSWDNEVTPAQIQNMSMREIRDLMNGFSGPEDELTNNGNGYGHHKRGHGFGNGHGFGRRNYENSK